MTRQWRVRAAERPARRRANPPSGRELRSWGEGRTVAIPPSGVTVFFVLGGFEGERAFRESRRSSAQRVRREKDEQRSAVAFGFAGSNVCGACEDAAPAARQSRGTARPQGGVLTSGRVRTKRIQFKLKKACNICQNFYNERITTYALASERSADRCHGRDEKNYGK